MKLYLDTSSNQKTIVGLGDQRVELDSSVWHSQVVLPILVKLLKKQNRSIKEITEIELNVGPGSYTGLRVGAAIANALGYALKIPVNGKMISENQIIEPVYQG